MINTTKVTDLNQTTIYQILNKFSQDQAFINNTYRKFQNYDFGELEEDILTSADDYYRLNKFNKNDMEEINHLLASLKEN